MFEPWFEHVAKIRALGFSIIVCPIGNLDRGGVDFNDFLKALVAVRQSARESCSI
jgi:hypothetical protein